MGGQTTTASISQVISTLIPIGLIAICGVTAFLVLRKKHLRIYQPRTFLTSLRPQERTPQFSDKGLFSWIPEYLKMPDSFVLNHQSMDAYFLLRFLRIGTLICLIGCCITWPILWPVYATAGGGATQFDLLSLSNVTGKNNPRLYAATFVAWVFFAFVWYMIAREQIYYINLRQAYLLSPLYANRISSKTVLYNSVPLEYCDKAVIRQLFKATPPKNVWISTDTKELTDLVDERRKAILQLEGAETKLIKTANDNRLKALKKNPQSVEEEQAQAAADVDGESGSAAGRWVKPSERPTHRLKMLIGKKVDSINWCREEIARLTPLIEKSQAEHRSGSAKAVGAVFVEFNSQAEAQSAFQSTTHHQALKMTPRFVGCTPEDIIWSNLRIKWWERLLRKLGTNTFVVLLLLFWAIPVAVVGLISNIYAVLPPSCAGPTATGPSWMVWLCFITKLPNVLFGLIQGLLPSVLLAVLMALVPIILRLMAKLGGAPTLSSVELSTQSTYFAFQIIETFLVTTIGSSASAVASQIGQNPGSTPTLLANNIPKAANIYMSYVIVVALSFFWSYLLQIAGLVLFYLLGKFLDNTPRKMYTRWMSLSGIGWGSLFPMYEFLVVICIIYSCWAPLLLGWSTIGLYLIYQAFRHNFFFVTNATIDTKGLVYPRALNHLTVGLYVAEVCYVGIFAVSEAPGPTVLMVIFLIVSILYHMTLNKALGPLLATLPTSLTVEEDRLQRLENSNGQTSNGHSNGHSNGNGNVNNSVSTAVDGKEKISSDGELQHRTSLPPAHKKPNFVSKWLRPDRYADYETLRRLVPHNFADIDYSAEIERESYYDPAIRDEAGLVWIPRDTMGISRQEVAHSGKVITTTDESSFLDDEGKIQWNKDELPPVYEEKIYY